MARFCVTMDLDYIIKSKPEEAGSMFKYVNSGESVSSEEIKTKAVILKAKGFKVMPVCENYDSDGYCTGHELQHRKVYD